MKPQIQLNNTKSAPKSNTLVAHTDGSFSVRIDGKWTRRVREISQEAFLELLRADRQRLTMMEFRSGCSLTGSPVIVSRPADGSIKRRVPLGEKFSLQMCAPDDPALPKPYGF